MLRLLSQRGGAHAIFHTLTPRLYYTPDALVCEFSHSILAAVKRM